MYLFKYSQIQQPFWGKIAEFTHVSTTKIHHMMADNEIVIRKYEHGMRNKLYRISVDL